MEEKVFYESRNVKITNARFIVGTQTYAMAAVSSVKTGTTDVTPQNIVPKLLIVFGAIWLLSAFTISGLGAMAYFFPGILLTAGVYWQCSIKKQYEFNIILTTSSGEVSALSSRNVDDIRPVELALNEAIVFRG